MPKWYGGSALNPDEIIPAKDQWQSQWSRFQRWYARTRDVREKSETSELSAGDIDLVIAFFQNCYHLRDWLQSSRPDLTTPLQELFAKNFEMRACRDICNGFKHKTLDKPSLDPDFNLYREYDPFQEEIDPSKSSVLYRLAFADAGDVRKFDMFEFADKCFLLWKSFLAKEVPEFIQKEKCEEGA